MSQTNYSHDTSIKMEKIQEIAQWVIDNRYPKSEIDKMTDFELYHGLIEKIQYLFNSQEQVIIKEVERRRDLILSEGSGTVREQMITNLALDL